MQIAIKCAFSILALSAFAAAQPVPPEAMRVAVEQHAVTLRVWDVDAATILEIGTGLIVSDDGARLIIATAEHVIAPARRVNPPPRVEVRFSGRDSWAEARLGATLPGEQVDLAYIEIDRVKSPRDARATIEPLSVARPPGDKERLWVFGYDRDEDRLTWRVGWQSGTPDPRLRFDCDALQPGYSGGVVATAGGVVGMIQSAGSNKKDHQALTYDQVLQRLKQAGVALSIRENAGIDALRQSRDGGLLLGLHAWDHTVRGGGGFVWAAIELDSGTGDAFAGSLFSGQDRSRITIRPDGADLVLSIQSDVSWSGGGNGATIRAGEARFVLSKRPVLSGFVEWELLDAGKREYYLAIPSERCELFAARFLASASAAAGRGRVSNSDRDVLYQRGRYDVNNTSPAYAMLIRLKFEGMIFTIPDKLHRDKEVRLSGNLVLGDVFRNAPHDRIAFLKRLDLAILPSADRTTRLCETEATHGRPFDCRFMPGDGSLRLGVKFGRMRSTEWFMLQGLTLHYAPD